MAGGRGKKIHVDPADVERLARKGHQQNDIASQLNISVDTYYERIKENSDIAEAYKKGREAFLEYIRKTRAERVLEALDELIANTVSAITGFGYVILNSVNTPYRLAANNAEYLACDLNLDLTITL